MSMGSWQGYLRQSNRKKSDTARYKGKNSKKIYKWLDCKYNGYNW